MKGNAMVRLEDLIPGAALRGVLPDRLVTIVAVQWYDTAAVELTYHDADGRPGTRLLYRGSGRRTRPSHAGDRRRDPRRRTRPRRAHRQ